ncbi:MAG: response regulator [Firmicutes bacterium]|nr:response regulator [Bacillota bacterium]
MSVRRVTDMTTILIVDDDVDVCRLLRFKLENIGYTCEVMTDGRVALDWLEQNSADLVLLDVMIPGYDGFYVLTEIRKKWPILPVIMLTAKAQEMNVIHGLELGANDYLAKPFSPAEVALRCKRWLGVVNGG